MVVRDVISVVAEFMVKMAEGKAGCVPSALRHNDVISVVTESMAIGLQRCEIKYDDTGKNVGASEACHWIITRVDKIQQP
jgi:hypothetical protein